MLLQIKSATPSKAGKRLRVRRFWVEARAANTILGAQNKQKKKEEKTSLLTLFILV